MPKQNKENPAIPPDKIPVKKMDDLVRDVGNIKTNFENSPESFEHARNLVDFCLSTRVAVTSLGIKSSTLDEALANPNVADHVRVHLAEDLNRVYALSKEHRTNTNTQADLELAESLARVSREPDSKILFFLFLCNNMINRHRKALDYLLGAAKQDLAKYGPLYIKNCFELKDQWLKKAIEFYEGNKELLDSVLDDRSKTMIAIAYDRIASAQSDGFTKKYDENLDGKNQYIQTKGLLAKAHAVYFGVYQNDLKQINEGQQPLTEESARHLTNYAVNLCQLNTLSDRNAHIDVFTANLKSHYRNESILILQDLIHRIDQMPSPSEKMRWKQKIAKVQLVYAAAGENLGSEINEKAIAIAEELKEDPDIQGTDGYSNFLNFYGTHLGIRRRHLESKDFSEEENVLLQALKANWKNPRTYLALGELYGQKGEPENSKRFFAYRHLVQAWIEMRRILRFDAGDATVKSPSSDEMPAEVNLNVPITRFNKALRAFLVETTGQGVTVEKLFKPLKKILRTYGKRTRKWIRSIVPEGANVSTHPKSPYLILLKMLREEMGSVTEINNLLTLRIETDTEEEAKQLCGHIEEGMEVSEKRDGTDGNGPESPASMEFVGRLPDDFFSFLVKVRIKEKGSLDEKRTVHYESYKRDAMDALEAKMAKDPEKYLQLFYDIMVRLGKANECLAQNSGVLSVSNTLKIYENPDEFMKKEGE